MTQAQALEILKTGANVFLTGEPGSGKTFVVNEYVRYLKACEVPVAVTASTGIAATHINGFTIHSWSGIGIKKRMSPYELDALEYKEPLFNRLNRTKVLIIDEISMLDASTLNLIDLVCRRLRRNENIFGGLQVVLVGDFFQLPPISVEGEAPADFAFMSAAWQEMRPLVCYLSEQHRQEDPDFLDILTAIRGNSLQVRHFQGLDARANELEDIYDKNITKLFPHNVNVDQLNQEELEKLPGRIRSFNMEKSGRPALSAQLERGCLSPAVLHLNVGAAVMFTKNNSKSFYVNGTLGEVVGFENFSGYPIIKARNGREITATPMEWTIEEGSRVLARLVQVPLRLAWAMTIHKSQGMSLEAVYIDLRQAFVSGQGYVAISRVRSLAGLFLAGYNRQALEINQTVFREDGMFRRQSDEAATVFSQIESEGLKELHKKFILSAGGKITKEQKFSGRKKKKDELSPDKQDNAAAGEKLKKNKVEKAYSVDKIREKYPNAYREWNEEEDIVLAELFESGEKIKAISGKLGRNSGAIRSRLAKLGMIEE
jgi:ATP-dependent DNA helicase PIF1